MTGDLDDIETIEAAPDPADDGDIKPESLSPQTTTSSRKPVPYLFSPLREKRLVILARAGREQSKRALILAEVPAIRRLTKMLEHKMPPGERADDIEQRVILKLLERNLSDIYESQPGKRFRQFVNRMINNEIKDSWRRKQSRPEDSLDAPVSAMDDSMPLVEALPSASRSAGEQAEINEEVMGLLYRAGSLPLRQRQIFSARALGDRLDEIINTHGISNGSAKTHSSHYRESLSEGPGMGFHDIPDSFNRAAHVSTSDKALNNNMLAAQKAAQRDLSDEDAFLFSAVHLREDQIAIADLAEALSLTIDEARRRVSMATVQVIDNMPMNERTPAFFKRLEDNFKRHKGRTINGFPFVETHVDLETPGNRPVYEQSWNILKDKPEHLYIFLAHQLYTEPHTVDMLAGKMQMAPAQVQNILAESIKMIRKAMPPSSKNVPALCLKLGTISDNVPDAREHALCVLDDALIILEQTGKIITHKDIAGMGSPYWAAGQQRLLSDYGLRVETLVETWITDQFMTFKGKCGNAPDDENEAVAKSHPKLKWGMIYDALKALHDSAADKIPDRQKLIPGTAPQPL